jgi:hypothetical protein
MHKNFDVFAGRLRLVEVAGEADFVAVRLAEMIGSGAA